MDIDFMLTMGEMFTLVAYGQLILEQAKLTSTKVEMVDQIFDFMIRDFSKYSTQLYSKPSSTKDQQEYAMKILQKPTLDQSRFDKIYNDEILSLADTYEMNR
jgi:acyl-CoA dehydrogenase